MRILRCSNCGRVLMEAGGKDFRIWVKCRRCKLENIFECSGEMLEKDATQENAAAQSS